MPDGVVLLVSHGFTDWVGFHSITQETYGAKFVFEGVTRVHWDNVICNSWLTEYIECKVMLVSVNGNIQEV
jgi:hypothetical protein